MQDSLGDRIKQQYECRTKYSLPRRTYTIIRVDGKAFHRYTKNLARPYDLQFMQNMDNMAAQELYSHKELNGKSCSEMQEMIFQKGVNWNDYPVGFKRGRFVTKENYEIEDGVVRTRCVVIEPPIFTQEMEFLASRIPKLPSLSIKAVPTTLLPRGMSLKSCMSVF
ncbi:MAG: hypothetical protein HQK52_17870 [Oligoflexia bacterium]|nr:hypothetical protein [Oligoflexia bacterium]